MPSARRRIASAVSLLLVSELGGRKVSVDYDGGQTSFDDVELYLHSRSPKALHVLEHACNKGLMTDDQIESLGSLALQHRDVPLFRLHLRCSEGREEEDEDEVDLSPSSLGFVMLLMFHILQLPDMLRPLLLTVRAGLFRSGIKSAEEALTSANVSLDMHVTAAVCFHQIPSCLAAIKSMESSAAHHDGHAMSSGLIEHEPLINMAEELLLPLFDDVIIHLRARPSAASRLLAYQSTSEVTRPFHALARAGASRLHGALAKCSIAAGEAWAAAYLHALQSLDYDGRTAFHVARCKWSDSHLQAMERGNRVFDGLIDAAKLLWASVADQQPWTSDLDFLKALPSDTHLREPATTSCEHADALKTVNGTIKATDVESVANGGWSKRSDHRRQPSCELDVVHGTLSQMGLTSVLFHSRPTLFKGALFGRKFRTHLSRERVLSQYGARRITVSPIPYADVFGTSVAQHLDVSISEFVAMMDSNRTADTAVNVSLYAFVSDFFGTTRKAIRKAANAMDALPKEIMKALPLDLQLQLFLGDRGSGAPLHHHQAAINALAFGRKRWLLKPPSRAAWSSQPSLEWAGSVDAGYSLDTTASKRQVLHCVQEAGDVLVLPEHWAHATVNEDVSVGVAFEFLGLRWSKLYSLMEMD